VFHFGGFDPMAKRRSQQYEKCMGVKNQLLPWDDVGVTHVKKITKLKGQVHQNEPKISEKIT
jgi:hypothetical protein